MFLEKFTPLAKIFTLLPTVTALTNFTSDMLHMHIICEGLIETSNLLKTIRFWLGRVQQISRMLLDYNVVLEKSTWTFNFIRSQFVPNWQNTIKLSSLNTILKRLWKLIEKDCEESKRFSEKIHSNNYKLTRIHHLSWDQIRDDF